MPNKPKKFIQIYFVEDQHAQAQIRINIFQDVKLETILEMYELLHQHNAHVWDFKSAKQRTETYDVRRVIITDRNPPAENSRRYHRPRTTEVGLLIVCQDFEKIVIVQVKQDGHDMRVLEIHRSYNALHYPLFFVLFCCLFLFCFLSRNRWLSLSPEENRS